MAQIYIKETKGTKYMTIELHKLLKVNLNGTYCNMKTQISIKGTKGTK